jgi:hypothetical protein
MIEVIALQFDLQTEVTYTRPEKPRGNIHTNGAQKNNNDN